jgi:ABC-type Na+ efflux pump permease subunit
VTSCAPPGDARMTWLIARRAAVESLRDGLTLLSGVAFAVVTPILLLWVTVRPLTTDPQSAADVPLGSVLVINLLLAGLLPTVAAAGVAAGLFAGEKERGILTPLLASPASNLAIFGGKVLGSILPSLLYALVAVTVYLIGLVILLGVDGLRVLPPVLSLATLCLVPAATCFAALIASLISSRVRTFSAAQQIAGLVLMPTLGSVVWLMFEAQRWGAGVFVAVVFGLLLLDVLLTMAAAATWQREEILAHR